MSKNLYYTALWPLKTLTNYCMKKADFIMKYNNNGIFISNIQLSKNDRNALRLIVDDYGKIYVLFDGEKEIGVEILAEQF